MTRHPIAKQVVVQSGVNLGKEPTVLFSGEKLYGILINFYSSKSSLFFSFGGEVQCQLMKNIRL